MTKDTWFFTGIKLIIYLIGLLASLITIIASISNRTTGLEPITPLSRIQVILTVGTCCAILHGALWQFIQKPFKWKFDGGEGQIPIGWSAIVLAATVWISLAIVPWASQTESTLKAIIYNN